jgi:hypothetical protein
LFVGHELVHGVWLPQVTMGKIGGGYGAALTLATALTLPLSRRERGRGVVELQHDLIAIVGETDFAVNLAVAVLVDIFADPAVFSILSRGASHLAEVAHASAASMASFVGLVSQSTDSLSRTVSSHEPRGAP